MNAPQNIYDNPDFFTGYARLRENPASANAVMVAPTLRALLPLLTGKRVVDLGCGTGGFCREALEEGAASAIGVDISERMLGVANADPVNPDTDNRLTYHRGSLDSWVAPGLSAGVVVSVLALHYLPDVLPVWANVARALAPGGTFIFCVEHPVVTAQHSHEGWVRDASGAKRCWGMDDYFDEGERSGEWIVPGVRTYHRTLATYLNGVTNAGLLIEQIVEPCPDAETRATYSPFADQHRRPLFLFVRATKPG